jgi:predicted DNA-binding protein with PD1-like motif
MLVKNLNNSWLIVLDKDQPVLQVLTQIVTENKIQGGHITGIGAVKNVELGFYELHKKDYIRKKFENDDYELIALNGNISIKDDAPYVHAHTALGKSDFSVFGGHLFEADVAVTAEIYITPFGLMPKRKLDASLGLATMSSCPIQGSR